MAHLGGDVDDDTRNFLLRAQHFLRRGLRGDEASPDVEIKHSIQMFITDARGS